MVEMRRRRDAAEMRVMMYFVHLNSLRYVVSLPPIVHLF